MVVCHSTGGGSSSLLVVVLKEETKGKKIDSDSSLSLLASFLSCLVMGVKPEGLKGSGVVGGDTK